MSPIYVYLNYKQNSNMLDECDYLVVYIQKIWILGDGSQRVYSYFILDELCLSINIIHGLSESLNGYCS